jgi:hypothetical protein
VAHPGHELRVHGWLSQARPLVFVLTDGSGRSGVSRLAYTRAVVTEAGAEAASVFGRFSDREAYDAVLSGDPAPWLAAVDDLAAALLERRASYVAGDAVEGYNAIHDVCRLIVNAAVRRARAHGLAVANYDFPLTGNPASCPPELGAEAIQIRLTPAQLERKLAAARRCHDLAPDLEEALRTVGPQAFAREVLRPAPAGGPDDGLPAHAVPFYERHGEGRVGEGKYERVLRRRDHVLPLAAIIWRHASGE